MNTTSPSYARACIGMGSNLGDSLTILQESWQQLGQVPGICLLKLSSPYRTEPVGMESAHWFINAVGMLATAMPPEQLLTTLLDLEHRFGRRRDSRQQGYQDRTLDLDLLLYDDRLLDTQRLQLPHPEMHKRLFVLVPLAELAPEYVHPRLQRTARQMKASLLGLDTGTSIEQLSWAGSGTV